MCMATDIFRRLVIGRAWACLSGLAGSAGVGLNLELQGYIQFAIIVGIITILVYSFLFPVPLLAGCGGGSIRCFIFICIMSHKKRYVYHLCYNIDRVNLRHGIQSLGIVTRDFCSCERACRERGVSQTAGGKQPAQKAFFLIVRSSD